MKIRLETLQHQTDALCAINNAFPGMDTMSNDSNANYIYANPLIKHRFRDEANIDIKMETGTGKTYVYTRMLYDFHQKYGLFKFVIAVPSPSIKEGTRSFINSDYAKRHFSEFYENTQIQLNVINAGDFNSRSGRRNFPAQLSEFVQATRQSTNQIEVLLINQGMLHSYSMHRKDYDQTLLGGETSPIKAIAATRPVLIIDEPQRFPRGKKFYDDIEEMEPQLIIRFGATFPESTTGRGKNKISKVDYYRGKPQFNLDAIDSFNQGLVKGVDIYFPDLPKEQANNLYRVKQAKARELVLSKGNKEYSLKVGEKLADVDSGFEGNITYDGGTDCELSNGLALSKDMKLIPGTFAENYQDKIISQALECHFKAEEENFLRPNSGNNPPKIKTLSLFFIDSISSFRGENNKKGWLAKHFEKLLTQKLKKMMDRYEMAIDERKKDYYSFLQATLRSLQSGHQDVYAGYFSEDIGSSNVDIQAEVKDILSNKEKLLSFKDKNGKWITRRFLFSKWTLREGWDNPNVFTIAKLRTSGSETSKIQEVGRGLRLPVDETGHRLTQDEWQSRLSFLVGYDEKDFAEKLVGEINDDSPVRLNCKELTKEMINLIVEERKKTDPQFNEDQLLEDLDSHGIITRSNKFKQNIEFKGKTMSGYEVLCCFYPELEQRSTVTKGKIRDNNSKEKTEVKLRKQNWLQLKKLWLQLSKRQMIKFSSSVNQVAEIVARNVFNDNDNNIFVLDQPEMNLQKISTGNVASVNGTQFDFKRDYVTMNYGKFLKTLAEKTDLSVNLLNNLMISAIKRLKGNTNYINGKTLCNLIKAFKNQFNDRIKTSYSYEPLDFSASTSIYNAKKHEFVDSVPANSIGVYQSNSTSDPSYLYDRPPLRYDSADPELKILQRSYGPKISVFGKLPKQAIKIPRFDNGTTTPDFIFKIEHSNKKPTYLVIETKAENMRLGDEQIRIIQQKYFDQLKETGVYYQMATSEQEVHDLISKLENG